MYNNTNKSKFRAFSLIELSIVLIIIGLLIAGVTGGKSLIDSAKTRALMNEVRNYKQAVNTYYAATGKLPGDTLNTGKMGRLIDGGYIINNDSFKPFIDLNDQGIVDFDKDTDEKVYGKPSNVYKNAVYKFSYINDNLFKNTNNPANQPYLVGLNSNALELNAKYDTRITALVVKSIDDKMDDGKYDGGSIRSFCLSAKDYDDPYQEGDFSILDYDTSIKQKGFCDEITFKLDI